VVKTSGRNIEIGKALLIVGGPVSNLALASGGIALLAIFLELEAEVIGTAIFGFYFVGLSIIYLLMGPALRLMGLTRLFRVILVLEGIVFGLFLQHTLREVWAIW